MKRHIFYLICVAAVFTSCSSAYKSTQTPDDVYYSPGTAREVRYADNRSNDDRYEDYVNSNDDQYLRMKVQNRARWNGIDDYDYWNDSRYDFGYGCSISRSSLFYSFNPYFSSGIYLGYGYPAWGWGNMYGYGYSGYYGYGYGGAWGYPGYTLIAYKNPKTTIARNTSYLNTYKNNNFSKAAYNNNNNFRNYNYSQRDNNGNYRYNNRNNSNYNYNRNNSNNNSYTPSSRSRPSSSGGGGGASSAPRSSGGGGRPPR